MANYTKLSSTVTVEDYTKMVEVQDKEKIANFISERFTERYIAPFSNNKQKNGFSMLAISCLMIEALESFRQGWPNSDRKSALAFCYFFDRSTNFHELKGYCQEFYKHIRCGLLHQAETTGGWHITRKKNTLFEKDTKTIDATLFLEKVGLEVEAYANELKESEWNSQLWKKTRVKLKHICKETNA